MMATQSKMLLNIFAWFNVVMAVPATADGLCYPTSIEPSAFSLGHEFDQDDRVTPPGQKNAPVILKSISLPVPGWARSPSKRTM